MQDATPPVTTRQVPVAEAARVLGISPETVRRWIKSGRLKADRQIRPQGTVWAVTLPSPTPRGVSPVTAGTPVSEASRSEPGQAPAAEAFHPSAAVTGFGSGQPAEAAALVEAIARLIAELAEVRVIADRRADQLVTQAETIGELRAELAALRAAQAPPVAPAAPIGVAAPRPPPGPWRRFWGRWAAKTSRRGRVYSPANGPA